MKARRRFLEISLGLMRIFLSPRTAYLCRYAARRGRRAVRLVAASSCLLAIFIASGGHWAVLQSIAYTRMLVEFAQQDSLCTAVKKAFDDRYACSLCPKIRDGCESERKAPSKLGETQQPEFLVECGVYICFMPSVVADVAFVSSRQIDFSNGPPKPPPRVA